MSELAHWLTAQDRCDACGAKAQIAARVKGTFLYYCGHHANEYEAKLRPLSDTWHDERDETTANVRAAVLN